MQTLNRYFLGLIGALAVAGTAYGQQPPDVVTSDSQENTAMGTGALISLTPDCGPNPPTCYYGNTASGYNALYSNLGGAGNTAVGAQALYSNTTTSLPGTLQVASGNANTALGYLALYSNIVGGGNTAVGNQALYSNTMTVISGGFSFGYGNTAIGYSALFGNTTGIRNTASGVYALYSNTTGNYNIAEGYQAGYYLTTGSNNIDIGSVGAAGESNTIHIGTRSTQNKTFIAGIYDSPVTGNAVMVNSYGRLGVVVSSERFKTAIAAMGANSEKLQQLRPVTFRLKNDPHGALQYGLIAEEVAKVYPELVIRDEKGRIDGVRYDELAPMLLNEMQQQVAEIRQLKEQQVRDRQQQLAELKDLKQELRAALIKLQSKDELVAQR